MAKSLVNVFKQYTRSSRTKAFSKLTSGKGLSELKKLLVNPNRPMSPFRQLSFRDWLEIEEDDAIIET
jgi:hypothetical protein